MVDRAGGYIATSGCTISQSNKKQRARKESAQYLTDEKTVSIKVYVL